MATAYISHKVYNKGIDYYFGANTEVPKVIGLFDEQDGAPGKLLAVSGLKMGTDKTSSTATWEDCSVKGNFSNKRLTIQTLPYEATKSLVTVEEGSEKKATYFAVIDASANDGEGPAPTTPEGNGIKNGSDEDATEKGILKPTALTGSTTMQELLGSGDTEHSSANKVILYGKLSNTPIIDATTNFYFSGATIDFTETVG